MNIDILLNFCASAVLTISVSVFSILLYRTDSIVRKWPFVGSYLLRLSLVAVAVGSLGNCLTLSTPSQTEITLNVGMSGLFAWAAWFHIKLLKDR